MSLLKKSHKKSLHEKEKQRKNERIKLWIENIFIQKFSHLNIKIFAAALFPISYVKPQPKCSQHSLYIPDNNTILPDIVFFRFLI